MPPSPNRHSARCFARVQRLISTPPCIANIFVCEGKEEIGEGNAKYPSADVGTARLLASVGPAALTGRIDGERAVDEFILRCEVHFSTVGGGRGPEGLGAKRGRGVESCWVNGRRVLMGCCGRTRRKSDWGMEA